MTNGIIDSGQEIVTNGLVLHLDAAQRRSYSGSGTVWTDLSGNSNNGTLTNGPTFNSANGGSIQVDGTDDYSLVSNKFMTGFTAFTFEMWVYATDNLGGTLCCYNVPTVHSGPQFSFDLNSIGLIVYNGNGSNYIYNYSTTLSNKINTWYHVVSTWTTAGIKLYLNGVDVSGSNVTLSPPTSVPGDVQGQIVAFRIAAGLTNQNSYFKGLISNIKVYNRALSGTEILQNYNATKARFEVPALLDLYPNAAAAYSLRKLRSGYTGSAIRVRRSSDNTEQDIGFTSTGDLDTTALTTFVGANNGFVSTWYDQSGNNRNATQTNTALQPIIVSGGTILLERNKPVIYANNRTNLMNIPSFTLISDYSIIIASSLKSFGRNMWMGTSSLSGYVRALDNQGGGFSIKHDGRVGGADFSGVQTLTPELHFFQRFGTNMSHSRNGVNSITSELSPQGLNFTINTLFDGYNDGIGYKMDANAFEIIIYNSNQSPNCIGIETNINSYYGIYNPTVVTMDTDAQAFITAASITDLVQQGAINTLVKTLKDVNLWTKMKAIYPFVGGTANSHKFNLKDPRDVDGAFRLVFNGGWTHSSTGALPDGSTGYANTFLTPSNSLTLNSTHLSYYSRTNNTEQRYQIGVLIPTITWLSISIRYGANSYGVVNALTENLFSDSSALGYYMTNRINTNSQTVLKNGVIRVTGNVNSTSLPTIPIFIGGVNNSSSSNYQLSSKECAFATIGDGLTDTEAANLYTAVQTFQTTLGRQV